MRPTAILCDRRLYNAIMAFFVVLPGVPPPRSACIDVTLRMIPAENKWTQRLATPITAMLCDRRLYNAIVAFFVVLPGMPPPRSAYLDVTLRMIPAENKWMHRLATPIQRYQRLQNSSHNGNATVTSTAVVTITYILPPAICPPGPA